MTTYDYILEGSDACELNARLIAAQMDWSEVDIKENTIKNKTYIDSVFKTEIWYDFGADYYFFAPIVS